MHGGNILQASQEMAKLELHVGRSEMLPQRTSGHVRLRVPCLIPFIESLVTALRCDVAHALSSYWQRSFLHRSLNPSLQPVPQCLIGVTVIMAVAASSFRAVGGATGTSAFFAHNLFHAQKASPILTEDEGAGAHPVPCEHPATTPSATLMGKAFFIACCVFHEKSILPVQSFQQ